MSYKIKIKENNKIKKINVVKLINQYERLIYKICIKWVQSFSFDRSIEIDDLVQELKIKYLHDLKSYDYREGNLIPYMYRIAINFFINKKKRIISNGSYPTDINGGIIYLLSISSPINGEEDITIEDTLEAKDDQHLDYYSEEIIRIIRRKLNKKKYKPNGFDANGKSFALEVFDLLYFQNEEFFKSIKFQHRCRVRKSMHIKNGKTPKVIVPTTKMIGNYMGVDKRTINSAYIIIKETISEIKGEL
jgi:RNA polymerase sigma factor (sigma-70 family)